MRERRMGARLRQGLRAAACAVASASAGAELAGQDIETSDEAAGGAAASITYLYGFGWDPGGAGRDVISVEYANGWAYGDNYFLFEAYELLAARDREVIHPTIYAEWHPRISLTAISGGRTRLGPVTNVALAGEVNLADDFTALLYGVGLDWRIPGIPWLTTNVYLRDDRALEGVTWHVLVASGGDVEFGGQRLKLFGYLDAFGAESGRDGLVYTEIQALLDVGRALLGAPGALFAGIELHASRNAFGNGSGTQVVPQLALQWGF